MKSYRSWKSLFSSVRPKLVLLTTLIFILIIIMIETFIYQVAIPREMNHAIEYNKQEVLSITERVEDTLSLYNLLTSAITMDSEVQHILGTDYKSRLEELQLNFELEKMLSAKNIISSDMFLNVFLYDNWKLRYRMNLSTDYDERFLKLNKYMYNPEGGIVWRVENGVIYIHRAIRDKSSLNVIGYITLMVDKQYWESRIQSATHRYTYIFNESDLPVVQAGHDFAYFTNSPLILSKSKRIHNGTPTVVSIRNDKDMLLTTYKSSKSLWRVSSIVPLEEITQGTRIIGRSIIAIGFIGVLIGCISLWFSLSFMFKPLKDLTHAMNRFEQDNVNLRINIQRRDEFGTLARSFNRMMDKINYLISDVYNKEISQKEAEFNALKAQINPHFLYNTLETIRLLCSFGENDKAEKATVSLARLLKSSISGNSRKLVKVKEELEIIEAYITIQNLRFEGKINVSINLDAALMNFEIPRFILQPIIENAYQHGLEPKLGQGYLFINGTLGHSGICFQVIDNGVGMSDFTLEAGSGHGMKNVHERIKLLFGEPYGLKVQSSPNVGTTIEISLPRRS